MRIKLESLKMPNPDTRPQEVIVRLWNELETGKHKDQEFDNLQHQKIFKAKISSSLPLNIMLDGEPFTVAQFTLTDMPKRINSLFHS